MSAPLPFDLRFGNIPTINLRIEFDATYDFINSPAAETCLRTSSASVRAAIMTWHGMPEDLFTCLLQRTILGLESYLSSALWRTSVMLGISTPELCSKLEKPSALGSKSLVANIYHRMPSAVHHQLSLRYQDQSLYERNAEFYQTVRNPIFHGKQLEKPKIEAVREAFDHLSKMFGWIDHWHPPETAIEGSIKIGQLLIKLPTFASRAP